MFVIISGVTHIWKDKGRKKWEWQIVLVLGFPSTQFSASNVLQLVPRMLCLRPPTSKSVKTGSLSFPLPLIYTLGVVWCLQMTGARESRLTWSYLTAVKRPWLFFFYIHTLFFCFYIHTLFFLFFFKGVGLFIYLFMAVLGLRFCARAFSSCGKRGPLFIAVHGPLTVVGSLVVEHRLQTRRLSSCGSRA